MRASEKRMSCSDRIAAKAVENETVQINEKSKLLLRLLDGKDNLIMTVA
jgi:hypothetical protein